MTPFALDHPAVREYLQRLDAATAHLPADERIEISEGIRSHLVTALAGAHTEADVRTALDALGDPEEIVGRPDAAGAPAPPPHHAAPPPASARGGLEIVAVIFLLVGAFIVPVIGWFVGVVLLWVSRAWTRTEKLLGTFVVPGGLGLAPLLLLFAPIAVDTCAGSKGAVTELVPGGGPVGGTVFVGPECSGGLPLWAGIILLVLVVVGPIVTAVYLLRAAGRRPAVSA